MDKPIPYLDHAAPSVAVSLIVTTLPDRDAAIGLGRALVDARLAACVQILDGLRSIYRWDGGIEESAECQLIAKAPPARAGALVARLRELHPYELPEIVTLDGTASAAYAAWLVAETGDPEP